MHTHFYFEPLLADPDINGGRQWGFAVVEDGKPTVGEPGDELGASHYLLAVHGVKAGRPPKLDYEKELAVQDAVRSLIRMGLIKSAHDCAEGSSRGQFFHIDIKA